MKIICDQHSMLWKKNYNLKNNLLNMEFRIYVYINFLTLNRLPNQLLKYFIRDLGFGTSIHEGKLISKNR